MRRYGMATDLAQLSPKQAPMTHLWEAKANNRNHTDVSRLQIVRLGFLSSSCRYFTKQEDDETIRKISELFIFTDYIIVTFN